MATLGDWAAVLEGATLGDCRHPLGRVGLRWPVEVSARGPGPVAVPTRGRWPVEVSAQGPVVLVARLTQGQVVLVADPTRGQVSVAVPTRGQVVPLEGPAQGRGLVELST